MRKKNNIIIFIWTILLIIGLTGCQAAAPNEDATSAADKTWRIGVMSDVGAVPFYIAEKNGFFKDAGVDVEVVVFRSAVDRDSALQSGALDGSMADMLSVVFYKDAGLDLKMVAETAGDYLMIASPLADTSDQQKTYTVGVSSNTVIDFVTDEVISNLDVPYTIEKVAIPQMPVRLEMLKQGELTFATLPEPLASASLTEGGEVIGTALNIDLHPGVLVFGSALRDDTDAAKAIVSGYQAAISYLNEGGAEKEYDALIENLGFSELLKPADVIPVYKVLSLPDKNTFSIVSEWLTTNEVTENSYDYDSVTDTSILSQNVD